MSAAPESVPAGLVPRRYRTVAGARRARTLRARRIAPLFESLLAGLDVSSRRAADPVAFVHRYPRPADQEIAGLVASALAFGTVASIRRSVEAALRRLGPAPAQTAREATCRTFAGLRHRWVGPADLAALVYGAAALAESAGGLGTAFRGAFERHGDLRPALTEFVTALRATDFRPVWGHRAPPPGLAYLLPDARGPGACKRLLMYLRWMVRGPDGVDLGLWPLPPRILRMPLDTHTARLCRYLGLTDRRQPSWAMAEEVTWHLAALDPDDPVRFDFALAHLGISRACRHRRLPEVCVDCPLEPGCRL